jgi:hypothetical protein
MHGLAPYFLGGLAAAALMNCLAGPAAWVRSAPASITPTTILEHAHKGDRLPVPALAGPKASVNSIEVGGQHRTAIIYRDREGRVVFRSDPLARVTLVARDVVLPQVTFRGHGKTYIIPLEAPSEASKPPPLAAGCDSAVSPLAAPLLARQPSRCIAAISRGASG